MRPSIHCCPGWATVTLLIGLVIGACSGPSAPSEALTFTFDFNQGPQGFIAGFADYPPAHAEIYALTSDYRSLPSPLEPQSGLFISGVNRSDDLFMFFKGPIAGLTPGARYSVMVSAEIATNTPAGCLWRRWLARRERLDQGRRHRSRTARGRRW